MAGPAICMVNGSHWRNHAYQALCRLCCGCLPSGLCLSCDAEETILTVTGNTTAAAEINMTLSDIEALGTARIVTTTPWHDGEVTFEGVPMSRLMEAVGANGTVAFVHALNNYSSEVPLSDFTRFEPILAYKMDGQEMSIADKGPLFIIYPYDDVSRIEERALLFSFCVAGSEH
jgi:hypothetical protein